MSLKLIVAARLRLYGIGANIITFAPEIITGDGPFRDKFVSIKKNQQ
jgi:hypothetical protein